VPTSAPLTTEVAPPRPEPGAERVTPPVGPKPADAPRAGTTRALPPITDLVEVTPPPALDRRDPRALVLTATALDSCTLRLQVDDDARHAQQYFFARRGESHVWTARRGFRVSARHASNLELRLNGKPIASPADGRALVLDRTLLDGAGSRREASSPPPARSNSAASRRRARDKSRAAAAPFAHTPSPEHAAGPPR
jgi:hypothetical protein